MRNRRFGDWVIGDLESGDRVIVRSAISIADHPITDLKSYLPSSSASFFFCKSSICLMWLSVSFWTSSRPLPLVVLGHLVVLQQLLQPLVGVAADGTNAVASLFGQLVDVARELLAPLVGERGIGMRITLPSFAGLRPRSDARIAFSMRPSCDGSNGCATINAGSGTERLASWLSGILGTVGFDVHADRESSPTRVPCGRRRARDGHAPARRSSAYRLPRIRLFEIVHIHRGLPNATR